MLEYGRGNFDLLNNEIYICKIKNINIDLIGHPGYKVIYEKL